MAVACIFVPDFAVEAVVRAAPELREQAVAVVEGTPPLLHVVAGNERARQAGIEAGMTKVQAQGRLPALEIRRRSPIQEAAAHAALMDCACAFSPRVEGDASAPDTVLLDLSGLERLFGPPAKIARELARRASEMGLEASVAVAGNADAARCAARGFPGVTVIPEGQEAERLGSLPVEVLPDIAADLVETLDRWGVRTLHALAALPEIALSERLGERGLQLQQLARGIGRHTLAAAEPPLTFAEAVELEYPVELLDPLAFVLNRMLEQLCARLAARALSTSELRLRLEYEDSPRHGDLKEDQSSRRSTLRNADPTIANYKLQNTNSSASRCLDDDYQLSLRLPVPMIDAKVFLKLLRLELQAKPPMAPVAKILVAAEPVRPRVAQGGLFLPSAPEPQRLEVTLARIRAVVGRYSGDELRVGSAELLDTHRPDAFRMRPFHAPEEKSNRGLTRMSADDNKSHANNGNLPLTALRRFRPPLPASVEVQDGVPVRMKDGNSETANVLWAAGPWRAVGEWWSEQPWMREEWDVAVAHDSGTALYRIFRDAASNKWFVEASYD